MPVNVVHATRSSALESSHESDVGTSATNGVETTATVIDDGVVTKRSCDHACVEAMGYCWSGAAVFAYGFAAQRLIIPGSAFPYSHAPQRRSRAIDRN